MPDVGRPHQGEALADAATSWQPMRLDMQVSIGHAIYACIAQTSSTARQLGSVAYHLAHGHDAIVRPMRACTLQDGVYGGFYATVHPFPASLLLRQTFKAFSVLKLASVGWHSQQ